MVHTDARADVIAPQVPQTRSVETIAQQYTVEVWEEQTTPYDILPDSAPYDRSHF